MLGLGLVGPGLGSAPSAWNEGTSWPEINGYVGKTTPDWAGGGGGGGGSVLGWVWPALAQHYGVNLWYWTPFHMLGLWPPW